MKTKSHLLNSSVGKNGSNRGNTHVHIFMTAETLRLVPWRVYDVVGRPSVFRMKVKFRA